MDHLKEGKAWANLAHKGTDRNEVQMSLSNVAIAHALIAIAEQLGKGLGVDVDLPSVFPIDIVTDRTK